MRNFPPQVGPPGEPVSAPEFFTSNNANDVLKELQNSIVSSGISLIDIASAADNTQLSETLSRHAAASTFYEDSGAANAYVLSPLNSFVAPAALLDGMFVRFFATNANTGASTVNVNGLGVKSLVDQDGSALVAGQIGTVFPTFAEYSLSGDKFIIRQPLKGNAGNFEPIAGAGMDFAAAGGSLLDYYEESLSWVPTVRGDATPGTYRASANVTSHRGQPRTFDLELTVRPFALQKPSQYAQGFWSYPGYFYIDTERQTESQIADIQRGRLVHLFSVSYTRTTKCL